MASTPQLEQAYLAHRPRLLRFLAARGAGDQAEDVLQDVWLRLAAAPDPAAAAGLGYMMRTADRLMIDRYRAQRQAALRDRAWADAQPGLADNIAPAPDAIRTIAARQQFAAVEAALALLGDRAAAVFRRHRIDGVPQRQIALELGVSLSTVESDLRRAYSVLADMRSASDEV